MSGGDPFSPSRDHSRQAGPEELLLRGGLCHRAGYQTGGFNLNSHTILPNELGCKVVRNMACFSE